jgi:MFS family permease
MNPRRLFIVSCLALVTSAFSFQMRQDSNEEVRQFFGLTQEMVGAIFGGQFLGMALAMLVFAFICDALGMGKVLAIAWLCHLTGFLGTIFAQDVAAMGFAGSLAGGLASASDWMTHTFNFSLLPDVAGTNTSFWVLWSAAFLIGAANGLVEIAINPLSATIYPDQKTHKLNVLHAWWPGGLIIAGLIAQFLINPLYGRPAEFFGYTIDPAQVGLGGGVLDKFPAWKLKFCCAGVPMLLYGLLSIGQFFPATERVQANVSAGTMVLQIFRPLFLLWAFCMLLTASTELGTNSFMESILRNTTRSPDHPAGISGTVIFVYTSLLMFVLRFFAGPIAHQFSPVGMLFFCSMLTAGGLYLLSIANTAALAFVAATVFGFGIAYYWPTMLGVTAERFPKGGALLMGLMGCIGNLAISQATPQIGKIYDSASVAALPPDVKEKAVTVEADGQPKTVPVVTQETVPSSLPPKVSEFLYPAGGQKLNPEALRAIDEKSPEGEAVSKAVSFGASFALRRIALMPCVLIVIFGLIALGDRLRGGYKAVRLTMDRPEPIAAATRPRWGKDDVFRR